MASDLDDLHKCSHCGGRFRIVCDCGSEPEIADPEPVRTPSNVDSYRQGRIDGHRAGQEEMRDYIADLLESDAKEYDEDLSGTLMKIARKIRILPLSDGRNLNGHNEQEPTEPLSACCSESVYYSKEHDNYYCSVCKKGQGNEFYLKYLGQKEVPMNGTVSVHPAAMIFWSLVVSFLVGLGAHAGWAVVGMLLR